MASSAEDISRFASKCHELASTCTTSFAKDALIDAAERMERKLDGLDGTLAHTARPGRSACGRGAPRPYTTSVFWQR